MSKILLLFLTIVLIFSGCASKANFSHTPVKQADFLKPIETLKQEYSDIEEYDRFFASPEEAARLEELEKMWGEPKKEVRWIEYGLGLGLITACTLFLYPICAISLVFQPMPREDYVWEKGDYTITAFSRNGIYVKYEDRIHNWEWKVKDLNSSVK
jgi:hypothetical protein